MGAKKEMQSAFGAEKGGAINDGAVRVCLNVAILLPTFVPQPQLTLSLSLAMIRGFARGVSDSIAPYIEKKGTNSTVAKMI